MRPLEGMLVLDLTRAIAGPYCTLYLADMGATVVKIENPHDPDFIRDYTPKVGGEEGISAPFAQYNRNKLSITLDLSRTEGQEIFRNLVKKADVVVENYRPGVMKKFGLAYETLKEINPRLVYTAITGFGQQGPYARRPAYDSCAQALGGLWSLNGNKDMPPVRVGTIVSDLVAGLNGVIGTLAAYHLAKAGGLGQMVDVAQLDATLAMTGYAVPNFSAGGLVGRPLGNEDSNVRPFEAFDTADGQVFFGGFNDKFFRIVCQYFGEPEFMDDPDIATFSRRNLPETYAQKVKPKLIAWFSTRTTGQLETDLADHVPLAPIKTIDEAMVDPQIRSRGMIVRSQYPEGELDSFATPIHLSESPVDSNGIAPAVGQDNLKVYRDLAGLDEAGIHELKALGVI